MRGQWLGTYSGTNSGSAIIDLDEVRNRLKGYAYMYDSGHQRRYAGLQCRLVSARVRSRSNFSVAANAVLC